MLSSVPRSRSRPKWSSISRRRPMCGSRSEEHTSELQSPCNLVCRLLLEKKKKSLMQPEREDVLVADPIALAAGEIERKAVVMLARERDGLEEVPHLLPVPLLLPKAVHRH